MFYHVPLHFSAKWGAPSYADKYQCVLASGLFAYFFLWMRRGLEGAGQVQTGEGWLRPYSYETAIREVTKADMVTFAESHLEVALRTIRELVLSSGRDELRHIPSFVVLEGAVLREEGLCLTHPILAVTSQEVSPLLGHLFQQK